VTWSSGSPSSGSCGDCSPLGGEILLNHIPSSGCTWAYGGAINVCGNLVQVTLQLSSGVADLTFSWMFGADTSTIYRYTWEPFEEFPCFGQSVFSRIQNSSICSFPASMTLEPA